MKPFLYYHIYIYIYIYIRAKEDIYQKKIAHVIYIMINQITYLHTYTHTYNIVRYVPHK
jgi:hypothetical protein